MKFPYYFWLGNTRMFRASSGIVRIAASQKPQATDRAGDEAAPYGAEKTVTRPYYLGSASMIQKREQHAPPMPPLGTRVPADYANRPRFSKATLLEAIEEAQRWLVADPKLTEVSIVKIVRVVRRAKPVPPPVTVEIEVVD